MLELNDVLGPAQDRGANIDGIVRVVGVSDDGQTVALIRLDIQPIRAPFNIALSMVDPDTATNGIIRIETFCMHLAPCKEALPKSKREKYEQVLNMMESTQGDLLLTLDAEYRGRELARVAQKFNVHKRTVRRHYYEYLWGGMTDLAFAGPQKRPDLPRKQQKVGTEKRGRKPKVTENAGQLPLPIVRENLEKGVRLYFLTGKYTELEAFVLTLQKFYSKGKTVLREPGSRIQLQDVLLPPEQCPTFRQFRYVAGLIKSAEGGRKSKPRAIHTPRKKSVPRGKARDGVAGPGYRYEIDATKIQIRIVSRLDPDKLVREATLYIIIDVWSGAIVGYALSLQSASWFLAAKALRNCFTPKTDVFKRLSLPYTADAWSSHHLPCRLAADRGELVSNKAGLIPELGIKLEIMASMRPERKGSVEGKFEDVKHSDNFYLKPGRHPKLLHRRGNDGKKTAALPLDDLEATIVEIIIDLNNDPVPVEYIPTQAVNAGISAVTYGGLFEWGLAHRAGFTRKLDPKVVTNELMLKGIASVTPQGIHFRKYNYTSAALIDSGLMERAAVSGAFPIDVRYDDLVGEQIRYLDPTQQDWLDVVNDNEDVQRLHASFWEIEEHREKAERLTLEAKRNNIVNKLEKSKSVNKRNRAAIARAVAAKSPGSRAQSKQAIGVNTQVEIAEARARRLSEQQRAAEALESDSLRKSEETQPPRPESIAPAAALQTIGQRTLELWKKKNADLGK